MFFAVWPGGRVFLFAVWAVAYLFFFCLGGGRGGGGACLFFGCLGGGLGVLLFGRGRVCFFVVWARACLSCCCSGGERVIFLLFGQVVCLFCSLGGGRGTGLPGSSLRAQQQKTKQEKKGSILSGRENTNTICLSGAG